MPHSWVLLTPLAETPFDQIAMDIAVPFPKSRAGYQFVLVLVDYATRYPDMVPFKSISVAKRAKELIKWTSRVGIPKEILMDQGTNFMSGVVRGVYYVKKSSVKNICLSPADRQPG